MKRIKLSIVVATGFIVTACSTLEPKLSTHHSSSKQAKSSKVDVQIAPRVINTTTSKNVSRRANALGKIDFRREANGDGKAIITLPHKDVVVSAFKSTNKITLKLSNTNPNKFSP